jgi:hypothetical protein
VRTLPPIAFDKESVQGKTEPANKLIMNVTIPFKMLKERYFVSFLIGRQIRKEDKSSSSAPGSRLQDSVIAFFAVSILLLILVSGTVFILYLIKSLLGIDIFSNAHILK